MNPILATVTSNINLTTKLYLLQFKCLLCNLAPFYQRPSDLCRVLLLIYSLLAILPPLLPQPSHSTSRPERSLSRVATNLQFTGHLSYHHHHSSLNHHTVHHDRKDLCRVMLLIYSLLAIYPTIQYLPLMCLPSVPNATLLYQVLASMMVCL